MGLGRRAGGRGTRVARDPDVGERSPGYLRLLLLLLASTAFFGDGYDNESLALLLDQIKTAFGVSAGAIGLAHGGIVAGQFVAFFLAWRADRVGRRPLLVATVVGYIVATTLTAASFDLWSFMVCQFFAQVCIGAEFGIAVAMVVEEFPPERRGRALGTLQTIGPLGAILAAALVAVGFAHSPLTWRGFFLVGAVPLVFVALGRRKLRETVPFEQARARNAGRPPVRQHLLEAWRRPGVRRVLLVVGAVALLESIPANSATTWWAYYAEHQRHFSSTTVSLFVIGAFGVGTLGYYSCGRVMDRIGRKPTAVLYLLLATGFGLGVFNVSSEVPSFFLLLGAVFFGLGLGPVLSAFATEPFPTDVRSQASSWVRNGFATLGSVIGPAVVGLLGEAGGAIGDIGGAVSVMCVLFLPAIVLIVAMVPETRGVALAEQGRPVVLGDAPPEGPGPLTG